MPSLQTLLNKLHWMYIYNRPKVWRKEERRNCLWAILTNTHDHSLTGLPFLHFDKTAFPLHKSNFVSSFRLSTHHSRVTFNVTPFLSTQGHEIFFKWHPGWLSTCPESAKTNLRYKTLKVRNSLRTMTSIHQNFELQNFATWLGQGGLRSVASQSTRDSLIEVFLELKMPWNTIYPFNNDLGRGVYKHTTNFEIVSQKAKVTQTDRKLVFIGAARSGTEVCNCFPNLEHSRKRFVQICIPEMLLAGSGLFGV